MTRRVYTGAPDGAWITVGEAVDVKFTVKQETVEEGILETLRLKKSIGDMLMGEGDITFEPGMLQKMLGYTGRGTTRLPDRNERWELPMKGEECGNCESNTVIVWDAFEGQNLCRQCYEWSAAKHTTRCECEECVAHPQPHQLAAQIMHVDSGFMRSLIDQPVRVAKTEDELEAHYVV